VFTTHAAAAVCPRSLPERLHNQAAVAEQPHAPPQPLFSRRDLTLALRKSFFVEYFSRVSISMSVFISAR
jgi:hypothetical protein